MASVDCWGQGDNVKVSWKGDKVRRFGSQNGIPWHMFSSISYLIAVKLEQMVRNIDLKIWKIWKIWNIRCKIFTSTSYMAKNWNYTLHLFCI